MFFIIGTAILVIAIDYTMLIVGRFFIGVGVGFGLAVSMTHVLLRQFANLNCLSFSWTPFTSRRFPPRHIAENWSRGQK